MNGCGESLQTQSIELSLSGDLTIRSITDIRARMVEAFRGHDVVSTKIADDAIVDLTLIQLMESARASARDAGKRFSLAAPATGPLRETLERGGFLAGLDDVRREFWLMESRDL